MSLVAQLSALATRIGNEIKGPDPSRSSRAWPAPGQFRLREWIQFSAPPNVASVTRLAAGRYRIQFETAMPDAKYCWVAWAQQRQQRHRFRCRTRYGRQQGRGGTGDRLYVIVGFVGRHHRDQPGGVR